jgi:hypothetical protein
MAPTVRVAERTLIVRGGNKRIAEKHREAQSCAVLRQQGAPSQGGTQSHDVLCVRAKITAPDARR